MRQVFQAIRSLEPRQLLVIADGARSAVPSDRQNCLEARAILEEVDWDCDLKTQFSEINLGCDQRLPTGLDWVFSQVDEAIILEDDCLPDPTFFQFCQNLLAQYRDCAEVTQICGTNRLYEWKSDRQSYHFAHYGVAWGWATWKRAWEHYDRSTSLWCDQATRLKIRRLIDNDEQFAYFSQTCETLMWDYKWSFAQLAQNGLTIIPSMNLVQNIGFSKTATHTRGLLLTSLNSSFSPESMQFPLTPPSSKERDRDYDQRHFQWSVGRPDIVCAEKVSQRSLSQGSLIKTYLIVNYFLALYPESRGLKEIKNKLSSCQ